MKSLALSIILKLIDKVTAPLKGVAGSFGKVKGSADQAIASISRLERVSTAVQRTSDKFGKLVEVAGKATAAVTAITGVSVGTLGSSAATVTAKFEDMYATLDTLYQGNARKVQEAQGWIKTFATTTPFEVDGITEAFTRLKAYGMNPMDGTLKTLGDTSAAMGKDIMASVEMMADAIMGENERLKEFGVKGSAIDGTDYIQYDYIDSKGQQQKRQVLKNDKEQIRRVLSEIFNDKYTGAMEKRSKTFNGILSNIKDTFANLQMQFMQSGPFEVLKKNLQGKLDTMNALAKSGKVEEWGRKTAELMTYASQHAGEFSTKVTILGKKVLDMVGGWRNLGKIAAGVGGLWLFGDLIAALAVSLTSLPVLILTVGAAFVDWHNVMPRLQQAWQAFQYWGGLSQLKQEVRGIANQLIILTTHTYQWGKHFYASLQHNQLLTTVKNNIQKLSDWFDIGKSKAQQLGKQLSKAFGSINVDALLQYLVTASKLASAFNPLKLSIGVFPTLEAAWNKAVQSIQGRLPTLKSQFGDVFGVIKQWLGDNASTMQALLADTAVTVLNKLADGLEWLSAKARDGSLRVWLDTATAKIGDVAWKVLDFTTNLLSSAGTVTDFTGKFVKFIGGWDNFAKLLAGGWLIAQLSGFLQGLGALVGIIAFMLSPMGMLVSLIAALAIYARLVYLEWDNMSFGSKALAIGVFTLVAAITAAIAVYKMYTTYLQVAAWWTAFQLTPLGAWIAGLSLASVWAGITSAATAILTAATSAFGVAVAIATSPITLIIIAIAALAAAAYLLWKNWDVIKPWLLSFWEDVKGVWNRFKIWVGELIDHLVKAFWDGWEKIKKWTAEFAVDLINFFLDLPAKMLELGQAIITGLWDGLKNSASAVIDWMTDLGSDIINSTKDVLGINSPSRVFAEIGGYTVDGMRLGMEAAQPKLFGFLAAFGEKLKGWWQDITSAFKSTDLADGIGKALDATKAALPAGVAAYIPGSAAVQAVTQAITGQTKLAPPTAHINPFTADSSVLSGMPTQGRISSEYGMRKHPVTGAYKMHQGVDIAAPAGTDVLSTGAGIVAYAGQVSGYGNVLVIQHDKGIQTFYAHLQGFEKDIKVGQNVQKGTRVGFVGSTGVSTGNHLHYEVRQVAIATAQAAQAGQATQAATQATAQLGAAVKNLGSGDQADRIKKAVETFESLGWTHKQAVGIVANLKQESELMAHPKPGDSGTAHGVAQWRGSRLKDFRDWAGKDISQSNLEDQLRFVHHELTQGKERSAGQRLKASETAQQAAAVVSQYYERPLRKEWEKTHRAGLATAIEKQLAGSRALGGPVDAGKFYRVNEVGPELFTTGGKTFLMASNPGRVTPVNQYPDAIKSLNMMASNDPEFARTLRGDTQTGKNAGDGADNVVVFQPKDYPPPSTTQNITITINAAPGMDERGIAEQVMKALRDNQRQLEARHRGRSYD